MKPIIRVEKLGKQYRIGARQAAYGTLRESLMGAVRSPFNRFKRNGHSARNTIWALKDVSFDIMPGEVVGIIGRNGAGKSTLLKILSRITEPTSGKADLHGRVGSLLEVGTGFHPELTGRENVYLNGAILGLKRSEIQHRFDAIVSFAEIDQFIDTPVKHFSSGMQMRLAFAVAAHLEPEILVIDEVLAVGDTVFQKKCLNMMESVARQGRTVLFVSHNLAVVRQLCSRGVLLRNGKISTIGNIEEVLNEYSSEIAVADEIAFPVHEDAQAYFARFCIRDMRGNKAAHIPHSEPFTAEIEYVVRKTISSDHLSWMLERNDGVYVLGSTDQDSLQPLSPVREPGRYVANVEFPGGVLNAGTYRYRVCLGTTTGRVRDYKEGTYFEVYDDTDYAAVNSAGKRNGVILLRMQWSERRID